MKKMNKFLSKHPNIIFASSGQGCGFSRMTVTVHRDCWFCKLQDGLRKGLGAVYSEI